MISKKSLISLIAAVLLIGAGIYFALSFNPDSKTKPDTDDAENVITIYNKDAEKISEIDVKLSDESFSFVRKDGKFVNKDYPEITLKSSSVDSLASDLALLVAKDIIKEGNINLSEYGLDNPKGEITVVFDDETKRLLIGSNTKDSAYFAKLDGDDRVFTLYSTRGDAFLRGFDEYRDTQILRVDGQELTKVSVIGGINDINLSKKDGKWYITSPVEREADETSANEKIFSVISYFSSENFVDNSDKNYEKYGLSNPKKYVYVEDSFGTKQKFYFGDSSDGYCYVRCDTQEGVFTMKEDTLSLFEVKNIEIADSFIYLPNVKNVKKIEISSEGKSYVLKSENGVYTIDGAQVLENKFKEIYQSIVGLRMSDFCFKNVSGDLICTVKFTMNDSSVREFKYVSAGDRQSVASENSNPIGYVPKKLINEMLDSLKN